MKLEGGSPTSVLIHKLGKTRMEIEVVEARSGRAVPRFAAFAAVARTGYPDRVSQWKNVGGGDTLDGRWSEEVSLIPGEELRVYLTSSFGFAGRTQHVNVMPTQDGVTKVRFEVSVLKEGADSARHWVEGRTVDDETGEVVPGVSVTVFGGPTADGEKALSSAQSFMDGTFRVPLTELPSRMTLAAEHPHYRADLTDVESAGGGEIRLRRRATLSGIVLGEDGVGHAGAPLLFRSPKLSPGSGSTGKPESVYARSVTDDEGRFEFPNLVSGRYMLCVCRGPKDPDEKALLRETVSVGAGEAKSVTLALEEPDRIEVTGTVRAPADLEPEPDYPLIPIFLPYGDGAWVQAKATGAGFDAGGLDRGQYLVVLAPANDDHTGGPFALLPGVAVEGFGQARLDFVYPSCAVSGRVLGLGGGLDYSVTIMPTLPPGFAAEFLATGKLDELFARPVSADGTFKLHGLSKGPHRLTLFQGGEEVAAQNIHVAGSQTLADWRPGFGE